MKKFIILAIAAAMLTTTLAACSNNGDDSTTTTTTTASEDAETTTGAEDAETSAESSETEAEDSGSDSDEITTASILDAIKTAYGDDYIPQMAIDETILSDMYGISSDLYSEFSGEMPMISTFVDTVIILKAADGQLEAATAALNAYRDAQLANQMQYPMNVAKVNACQVVSNGDFVAFIMLGALDERDEASEEDKATFANEQTQIGVDAFNSCF